MTTIANKKCKTHYNPTYVLDSTLCAVGNPLNNTCKGDSGGPVVTLNGKEATHVAIVSFGDAPHDPQDMFALNRILILFMKIREFIEKSN